MENDFIDVVICTPGSSMHPEYVRSLVATCRALSERGMSYKYVSRYSSFVATARELCALDEDSETWDAGAPVCGGVGYGKMFWIDSDVSFEVSDFMRLLESPLEIVSGLYRLDRAGTVAVADRGEDGLPKRVNQVHFLLHDAPVQVVGVGFGFLCVKAGIFEDMSRPWFKIGEVDIEGMKVNLGEDYSWCYSAARAGYEVWVDPEVKVVHWKEVSYEVN